MIPLNIMPSHAKESLILTAYPLSTAFECAVRDIFGQGTQAISVAQLRSQGLTGMLRQFWSIRADSIVLPIEEENSSALLPVLKLIAACTRSRSIRVVHPDLRCEMVSRWQIALDALRFASASASCLWSAHLARRELSVLLTQPRLQSGSLTNNGAVLYLKTNLWFGIKAGGSVGHIAGVINGLQRLGYPLTFASAEPPVMLDEGVKFLPVQPPRAFGLPYELNNYRFQLGFQRTLEAESVLASTNLIYQRLSAANYLGVVLSRRHRLPLVVEYNGSEVWVAKHWGRGMKFQKLAEMAEKSMLRHAHLIVTVSDALREDLISRGVDSDRIVMYPNCIDPLIFDPDRYSEQSIRELRIKLNIPIDAVVVTFVGTFGQWHGPERLSQAIALLFDKERDWVGSCGIHFLFVGDGLTRPRVEEMINYSNARGICTFTGLVPQAETPLYLAASDVLVSPHVSNADGSRFFGSPTKLFEYMAMGKAIIASDLEQIGEVLSPGIRINNINSFDFSSEITEAAILTKPGDASEIAKALKFLVNNPSLRKVLGKNARAKAIKNYTWDVHVGKIIDGLR